MSAEAKHKSGATRRWLLQAGAALLICVLGLATASVQADSYDDRRVRTGARLVRALLAADEDASGRAKASGQLAVQVYAGANASVDAIIPLIAPMGDAGPTKVRGLPVRVTRAQRLPPDSEPLPTVVFLAVPLDSAEFSELLAWCIANGVVLYSPFEGDVERGATAGLSVQAKVQPFLNLATLEASRIKLRPFFLDHSRVWR